MAVPMLLSRYYRN